MRIVCLGDSLTSGYSQGEDKYPYGTVLQKLLDKEVGKGKHEVITVSYTHLTLPTKA